MTGERRRLAEAARPIGTVATRGPQQRLRLLLLMAQGPAGAVPEAWQVFSRIEDARSGARGALRHPQVLRVAIVEENDPLRFIEWAG